jgi:hypothetical protein
LIDGHARQAACHARVHVLHQATAVHACSRATPKEIRYTQPGLSELNDPAIKVPQRWCDSRHVHGIC